MRVVQLRTWITNIGNGFIDKGAVQCVQNSLDSPEIVEVSGLGNKAESQSGIFFLSRYLLDRLQIRSSNKPEPVRSPINTSELLDFDVAIMSGCILDRHLEWYQETLTEISKRDIPIILLGAGGLNYDSKTQARVRTLLSDLNVQGMITRDDRAYDCYSNIIPNVYRGIDCAFFIDEWYSPPSSNKDFIACTFDKNKDPKINSPLTTVYPYHKSLTTPMSGFLTEIGEILIQQIRQRRLDFFDTNNVLISDILEDYLFVYKNAVETHSDRVHACVPSLVYGNEAKFYMETPRGSLFDRVIEQDIQRELVSIDREHLRAQKKEQENNLRKIVSKVV